MSPKELVQRWVSAYNRNDLSQLVAFYVQTAIYHEVGQSPIIGQTAIESRLLELKAQKDEPIQVENLIVDGDWAVLESKELLGDRACILFQVRSDLIHFQRNYS